MTHRFSIHVKNVTNSGLAAVLVICLGCSSGGGDDPEDTLRDSPAAKPSFDETGTATLTHKGRTLEFKSAVGSMPADSKVLEVFFFPYQLSDAQKSELLEGSSPTGVNDEAGGHDLENWPHKPIFEFKIRFKDDAEGYTPDAIDGCNLSISGWENANSTSGVPLEATIDTLTLSERKAGGKLNVKGSAKDRNGEETTVTVEADTILLVPPF
jgi:hypothetical protein